MFRLATNCDIVYLKRTIGDIFPHGRAVEWSWGLKSLGYMYILEHIKHFRKQNLHSLPRVLEMGVGLGDILYNKVQGLAEYIAVDKAGFYNSSKFDQAIMRREGSQHIDAFVGEFNESIPDGSVDVLCSVSVLEHVPISNISDCVDDMYRILKKGGICVHSLDVHRGQEEMWMTYREALLSNGLLQDAGDEINFHVDGILYEPLPIVYNAYEKRPELDHKIKAVSRNYGTILILATK